MAIVILASHLPKILLDKIAKLDRLQGVLSKRRIKAPPEELTSNNQVRRGSRGSTYQAVCELPSPPGSLSCFKEAFGSALPSFRTKSPVCLETQSGPAIQGCNVNTLKVPGITGGYG